MNIRVQWFAVVYDIEGCINRIVVVYHVTFILLSLVKSIRWIETQL